MVGQVLFHSGYWGKARVIRASDRQFLWKNATCSKQHWSQISA